MQIDYESHLDRLVADILRLTQFDPRRTTVLSVEVPELMAQLESLTSKLKLLGEGHEKSEYYVRVIVSLHFQEVRKRFDKIPVADQRSNNWIYDEKATTFVPWLRTGGCVNSIYYIQGKVRRPA
jgi:hypothetical protein